MFKKIIVNDLMQQGYTYFLTEPEGENFDPRFKPDLTPKQMLEMGVFGGKYMTDCQNEFPKNWFTKAKLCHEFHDPKINFFGLNASQSLTIWQKKGWINSNDPRGWFQWYCRYYLGRRDEDDDRQIKRWIAMKRHVSQVKKYCPVGEKLCRPKQRQALLHWAYNSVVL